MHGDWGVDRLASRASTESFLNALTDRSALTWQDINTSSRKGLGWEKANGFKFTVPIPNCCAEKTLYAFRIRGNNGRFVGFRSGRVFSIVFVDPGFDLYEH